MDYWIGRLIELTGTLGRPPFILVIADHGEAMGEYQERPIRYGFGHGGLLLKGIVHVPFIVNWPGMAPAGAVIDDVAEAVDVAPTKQIQRQCGWKGHLRQWVRKHDLRWKLDTLTGRSEPSRAIRQQ